MEVKTLYRTVRDGKTTISLVEPQGDYTITYRVVASEGKEITNGEITCQCMDTDNPEEWTEIEDTEAEEVLAILTGESE